MNLIHCFGDKDVQHCHQMRHLFLLRTSHKRRVARELLKKIIDGRFVLCRMQHSLAKRTQMLWKILRRGIHAPHGTRKIFPVYGSLTADPDAKALTSM